MNVKISFHKFLIFLSSVFICACTSDAKFTQAGNKNADGVKFKYLLGVNGHEWDFLGDATGKGPGNKIYEPKMNMIKSFSGVRHYIDWDKLETTQGNYTYNPTHKGGWNYDTIYTRSKAEGIEILPCIKNTPDWMYNTYPEGERDMDNLPLFKGAAREQPGSYIDMAKLGFQFAARYGSNKHIDSSLVKVNGKERWNEDGVNVVRIGMGVIKYIECNNEPDKWWKGKRAQFSPAEFAASLSAFYDGHKGTMGKGVGVKNADPSIKVAMGGIAKPDVNFVKDMVEWCKKNRGYRADGSVNLCFDIINYHMYSNDNTSWFSKFSSKKRGMAPELNNMGKIADSFVDLARTLGPPNVEVWSTELGYDLREQSIQRAIPIGSKSAQLTQADWIVRSSLLYARHGVSRIFFYQLFDSDEPGANSGNPFGASGLLNLDSRRPAADYLLQLGKLMGEYRYSHTLNQDPFVDVYHLNKKEMYALVVPDEVGRTEDYELDLKGAKNAMIFSLKPGADQVEQKKVATSGGILKIKVTETPVFVQAL
ncbi:hypothetical protein [Pedobacter steynii]|uniref:Glycoside hydrolase family 42 N-terminal domain-containing protein n=1 Tax=Pedobacter steynii TaxID=430522 RepID=A0A1D7QNU6_9SPHI|nr:hypothetical protein [Pedobacter steynii]AOM80326.1 hypothetical protein BFS30_26070 [Pedobacter steynii]